MAQCLHVAVIENVNVFSVDSASAVLCSVDYPVWRERGIAPVLVRLPHLPQQREQAQ